MRTKFWIAYTKNKRADGTEYFYISKAHGNQMPAMYMSEAIARRYHPDATLKEIDLEKYLENDIEN